MQTGVAQKGEQESSQPQPKTSRAAQHQLIILTNSQHPQKRRKAPSVIKRLQKKSMMRVRLYERYIVHFQMRPATSKEKLSQMHEALDRELEQIAAQPRSSSSRRDREELRYSSCLDDPHRPPKPFVFDHTAKEGAINSKKSEISELERKLMELERKMDNVDLLSSDEESATAPKQRTALAFQSHKDTLPNEDTARFLLEANAEAKPKTGKLLYSYPSLEDEEEEDEDSEDYAEIQRAIEKKKQETRELTAKRTTNINPNLNPNPKPKPSARSSHEPHNKKDAERKISTQVESVLKPKYSNEKANRAEKAKSTQKRSVRDSVTSKKSQEKATQQHSQQLNRANSKRSVNSNAANSMRGSRQHSRDSMEKHDRSFDRFSEKEQCLHSEEVSLARDLKRMSNLQREVVHYKRLAQKYKQQLQQYRVMQVQLRELRKNFAKSELIRTQQKKVIQTLKSKISK